MHFEHGQQTASDVDSDAIYQMLERLGAGQVQGRCWRSAGEVLEKSRGDAGVVLESF